ncbi:MAG: ATP-binding cassette domain-containing protein [Blautia hansenii]|nr:ATP-binding cassette domain-containing protein [uncultured Blautia sp.]
MERNRKGEDFMEYVIETQNLCKSYRGKAAVSSLNMHVQKGDIYGFIGRNGAGKSTTLKMLCNLAHPTEGSISLFGKSPDTPSVRRRMGVLIETAGLEPSCSAHENMVLKALLMGIVDPEKQICQLLRLVRLNPGDKKKARHFSMGMKQRLGIAMALLGGPDLLILDEPINGLDPEGMNEVRRILMDLNRKKGITILISSHILGELSKMATRYGIIKDGCLIQELSSEELNDKCRDYLCVKTADSKKASVLLEQQLGLSRYEVHPNGEIRIYQKLDSSAVTSVLTSADISVQAIYTHHQDLEGYFLELMEQNKSQEKGGIFYA